MAETDTHTIWLTQEAFDKLLIALGGDRESGSEKYLEIRNNLTRFFEWRGCSFPEDHADETINRMAKRVAEGEAILNHSGYAMGVARLLLLEINKGRQREQTALAEMPLVVAAPFDDVDLLDVMTSRRPRDRPRGARAIKHCPSEAEPR